LVISPRWRLDVLEYWVFRRREEAKERLEVK
jgi:hypothetical protein